MFYPNHTSPQAVPFRKVTSLPYIWKFLFVKWGTALDLSFLSALKFPRKANIILLEKGQELTHWNTLRDFWRTIKVLHFLFRHSFPRQRVPTRPEPGLPLPSHHSTRCVGECWSSVNGRDIGENLWAISEIRKYFLHRILNQLFSKFHEWMDNLSAGYSF